MGSLAPMLFLYNKFGQLQGLSHLFPFFLGSLTFVVCCPLSEKHCSCILSSAWVVKSWKSLFYIMASCGSQNSFLLIHETYFCYIYNSKWWLFSLSHWRYHPTVLLLLLKSHLSLPHSFESSMLFNFNFF